MARLSKFCLNDICQSLSTSKWQLVMSFGDQLKFIFSLFVEDDPANKKWGKWKRSEVSGEFTTAEPFLRWRNWEVDNRPREELTFEKSSTRHSTLNVHAYLV